MNGAKTYLCSAVEGWTVWYRPQDSDDFSLPDRSPVGFLSGQIYQTGGCGLSIVCHHLFVAKNSTDIPTKTAFIWLVTLIRFISFDILPFSSHPNTLIWYFGSTFTFSVIMQILFACLFTFGFATINKFVSLGSAEVYWGCSNRLGF